MSLTLVANLPLVSTTPAVLVAKFAASVVDIGGAPLLVNISANFRKKNGYDPDVIFRGLGEDDS